MINQDYITYIRAKIGHAPFNITGVNVLIINANNQVLLQKRGTYPFTWGLIGGITELGESLENTCIREAKEETGLSINHLHLLGTTSGSDCYIEFPNKDQAYFISIGYYTYDYTGTLIHENEETQALRFFSYDNLPNGIPRTHQHMLDLYFCK